MRKRRCKLRNCSKKVEEGLQYWENLVARSPCQGREVGEVRGAGERKIEAVELWQSEKLWKQELRESRNGGWRGVVHWPEIRTLNLEAE